MTQNNPEFKSNRLDILRDKILRHGEYLDTLPEGKSPLCITPLGAGGLQLTQTAARALVALFRGDDDLIIVDRDLLHRQLIRVGNSPDNIDLLLHQTGSRIPRQRLRPKALFSQSLSTD